MPRDIAISIIIVNYNVQYFLEQCLLSVQKASSALPCEVWVVDNASSDGSVEMLKTQFPSVRLICNADNVGFAKANNQALKLARGEFSLLLNPDTIIDEQTLIQCHKFMQKTPNAGALGVRMIDGAGNFLPESKRGFPSAWASFCKITGLWRAFPNSFFFNAYYAGHLGERETSPVDVLSGAYLFLRKSALEKIGLLDEAFFMYGEDIDLSYRLQQAGFQNYYFPETTIIHYKGESTQKDGTQYVKHFYRAMLIFAKKHLQNRQALPTLLLIQLAIYSSGFFSIAKRIIISIFPWLFDAAILALTLHFSKEFWELAYFKNPAYYDKETTWIIFLIYIFIWLSSIYFIKKEKKTFQPLRLMLGMALGTLLISVLYAFLPLSYRFSRMLIILGSLFGTIALLSWHFLMKILTDKKIPSLKPKPLHLFIIGSEAEIARAKSFFVGQKVHTNEYVICKNDNHIKIINNIQLVENLNTIQEIIFCAKDVSSQEMIETMSALGATFRYRVMPATGSSIIGSHSKNKRGEIYTLAINFDKKNDQSTWWHELF